MRFLTRNAAGLNSPYKLHQVMCQARQHDVSLIQETKLMPSQTSLVRAKWGSPNNVFMSSATTSRRGVLTLIHPRVNAEPLNTVSHPAGQFHILIARIQSEIWAIINVYGEPGDDRPSEEVMLALNGHMDQLFQDYPIQNTVMAGDFNLVLQASDTTTQTRKPRAEAVLSTIVNVHDLYDVAAIQSPVPAHTYFRHRMEGTRARYDRFYCSANLLAGSTCKLLPRTGDHSPVQFSTVQSSAPKPWKFSDELLSDHSFLEGLHNHLQLALAEYSDNSQAPLLQMQEHIDFDRHSSSLIFSTVVRKVRDFCVLETKKRRQARKENEDKLVDELIQAREAFNAASPPTAEDTENLETAQQKLMISLNARSQAASNRNHINYSGFGERVSRYHFQRSRNGRATRDIPKLILHSEEGDTVLEGQDVPRHMFEKYARIIQEDPEADRVSIREFLGPELTDSLRICPEHDHLMLTSPILPIEIKNVVKEFKTASAPGPLGLSNNLLKHIVPFILDILVDFGNKLFFGENIPEIDGFFFHRTVIFILKPGKSSLDPDSYRGLSLLEGFFKIYSKILASRIQRPMMIIQDPQQFGFTKGKGCLEASRTVIDTITHARLNNKPLIVISTDFKKAFDSISLNHIEACLDIYKFPESFKTAFMRLVRSGTMQFEVNSMMSDDHELKAGTGQGDPKSSFAFNLSAAPLNHYLAKSPEVPRYEIDDTGSSPVFYADDDLTLLQGDMIEQVLGMLRKIQQFRQVSGLFLNLPKCEIMAINCNEADIDRLLSQTGMRRVTTLKHLGLLINDSGHLSYEDNILPIQNAMLRISNSLDTNSSTPLGRAIYAKFLLSSRYIHKIQNFSFTPQQLTDLREAVLKLTWTRHRIGTDTTSTRVHIAGDRVAQPLQFGGLSLPHPLTQSQATRFSWIRKLLNPNANLTWVRILELNLRNHGRPSIGMHFQLGYHEWRMTDEALTPSFPFWAEVFRTGALLMQLSHRYDQLWSLIPILGYEEADFQQIDISTLSYVNPAARILTDAGLVNIGQLFCLNDLGQVDRRNAKPFEQLEAEFHLTLSTPIKNSLTGLINHIRRRFARNYSHLPSSSTTLVSLVRTNKSGCNAATRLILKEMRKNWEWGDFIKSFFTYSRDDLINISSEEFSKSFYRSRRSTLSPSVQWNSLQVLLRTLWTNVKEQRSSRGRLDYNLSNPLCSNCHLHPEHTIHLLVHCSVANGVWIRISEKLNDSIRQTRNMIHDIVLSSDNILFNFPPEHLTDAESRDCLDIIMLVKHILYRLRFRANIDAVPSARRILVELVIELEKACLVRNHLNKNTTLFLIFIGHIKNIVGF